MKRHRRVGMIAVALLGLAGAALQSRAQDRPSPPPAVFSARSELVVLHVMVTDRYRTYVSGLDRAAFAVFEDDQPQQIEFFSPVDTPVTVGLVIDNSASMYGTRELVVAAAGAFASTSNPHDEIFALAFNDDVFTVLPPTDPFTSDRVVLQQALARAISARGRTALNDAIVEGLDVVGKGQYARRVLVLVSDGDDNASRATFDEIRRRTEASNTAIYAIAVRDPAGDTGRPDRLKQLAVGTGGQLFRPHTPAGIDQALRTIARDIRNTYTVGYVSTNTAQDGRVRTIRVTARGDHGQVLRVRTREGYVVEKR